MTETEFWTYLSNERKKGNANVVAGAFSRGSNGKMTQSQRYITSHAILPANYQNIPQSAILSMGELLFKKGVNYDTKEAIMILLAHQETKDAIFILNEYNLNPDEELRIFAALALDECLMRNEVGTELEQV